MTFSKIQIHLNASRCGFTRESIHFHVQYSPGKSQLRTSTEHHHGAELLPDQLVGEKKKKRYPKMAGTWQSLNCGTLTEVQKRK